MILCGIADETSGVGEGGVGGGFLVTLVVGDNLDTVILPDANAAVWVDENTQASKVNQETPTDQ